MEDDDDLEVLRLMALKTLHKKENAPTQQPKNLPPPPPHQQQPAAHPPINVMVNNTIPVLNNVRPPMGNNFYPTMDPTKSNIIHHTVPPFVNSGFEKMDINEPYVPQRIHPSLHPFNGFQNYVPSSTTTTTTAIGEPNVQLSPRTAAFVLANKETIERRRIVSPELYRKSPCRWSRSPSSDSWKFRRSVSRSPSYHNHSPNIRNRLVTPPPRRRHSPTALHNRKSRSRSPISRNQHENNYHRAEKRSPNRNRGNAPPYNNRNERKFRGHEPHRCGDIVRKSNSPRTDDPNHRNNKRRTQSPLNSKLDVKKRSTSRSPNRRYPRNNNLNLRRGRRSPPQPGKRFNPNDNRQNNTNARNRNYNTRRSASPSMNRRNESRTPPNQQKQTMSTKNEDELTKKPAENESKSKRNENTEMNDETSNKKSDTETATNVPRGKTEQDIEDELLESERDDNSDSDNDDDGIDLFASEDSESENEGRFKLSSSKSERKTNVATVSFSELGKTAAPSADVLRNLDEVQTDAGPSHRKGNPRRENGRDTRVGYSRRHNEKRSYSVRDRSDRDRDRSDRGTRERENRDSNKLVGSNSRRKDVDTEQTSARSERKQITLKSTLNATEGESRRKTPEAGMTKNRFFSTLGNIIMENHILIFQPKMQKPKKKRAMN